VIDFMGAILYYVTNNFSIPRRFFAFFRFFIDRVKECEGGTRNSIVADNGCFRIPKLLKMGVKT